jgi:hypothetical protein
MISNASSGAETTFGNVNEMTGKNAGHIERMSVVELNDIKKPHIVMLLCCYSLEDQHVFLHVFCHNRGTER